jgi:hypothetical protein
MVRTAFAVLGLSVVTMLGCSSESREADHRTASSEQGAGVEPQLSRPIDANAADSASGASLTAPPPTAPTTPTAPTQPTMPPTSNPPPTPVATMPPALVCVAPWQGPNTRGWCYYCEAPSYYDDPTNTCIMPCLSGLSGPGGGGDARCYNTPGMLGD